MPMRQQAALRLLCHHPHIERVVLSDCNLGDDMSEVLAEVLSLGASLTSLSLHSNDLREPGCAP